MKKILKQRGFYAVLAVAVLVTAALVMTCINPVDLTSLQGYGEIPEGMGAIKLTVKNADRTINPNTAGITLYTIYVNDAPLDPPLEYINAAVLATTTLTLAPGPCTISVAAAITNGGAYVLKGSTDVTIIAGGNPAAAIDLKGIVDGVANGTFVYNITLPAEADTGSMVVTPRAPAGGRTGFTEADLVTNSSGSTPLASGYYDIVITYGDSDVDTDYDGKERRWVLHIFPGATSTLAEALGITKYRFKVTFDENGGVAGYDFSRLVNNGTTTTAPATLPTHTTPGYTVQSWHTAATTSSTNIWVFASDRVWDDMTLYAQWGSNEGTISITIDFNDPDVEVNGGTVAFKTSEFGTAAATASATVSISTDRDPGLIAGVQWYIDGNLLAATNPLTLTNNQAGLDSGYLNTSAPVKIDVMCTIDDIPFSGFVTVTYTNDR